MGVFMKGFHIDDPTILDVDGVHSPMGAGLDLAHLVSFNRTRCVEWLLRWKPLPAICSAGA